MALGSTFQCRIVVYECTDTNTRTNDLINIKKSTKKFFFCKNWTVTFRSCCWFEKLRNPDLFTESTDSEIEITKVVPAGKSSNNNPTEINIKQEDVSEIQTTKVISANEQNNNSPTEIDIK